MRNPACLLIMLVTSTLLFSSGFIAIAAESATLNPVGYACVSNVGAGEEYLTVRYEQGLKWISFFAFNLSEIPAGSSVDDALLKIKTEYVINSAWVSAYSSPDTDWVQTGISWDTKPDVNEYVDAVWVSAWEEWYTWESSSLTEAISETLAGPKGLTIMLKSGLLIDQTGHIIFHPEARLEITYTRENSPPTIADIVMEPRNPTPDDLAKVNASATDNESGIKEVSLVYSTDGGQNWIRSQMSIIEETIYNGTIPRQDKDTIVQYYIEAIDNAGNLRESPRYSYTVRTMEDQEKFGVFALSFLVTFATILALVGLVVVVIVIAYLVWKRKRGHKP